MLLEIGGVDGCFAPLGRSQVVDRAVHGDTGQPGTHLGPGLEAAQLSVNLEPGVLDDVLRILGVSHQAIDHAEEVAAVLFNERTKRVNVAISRFGDYRGVALGHA